MYEDGPLYGPIEGLCTKSGKCYSLSQVYASVRIPWYVDVNVVLYLFLKMHSPWFVRDGWQIF